MKIFDPKSIDWFNAVELMERCRSVERFEDGGPKPGHGYFACLNYLIRFHSVSNVLVRTFVVGQVLSLPENEKNQVCFGVSNKDFAQSLRFVWNI